MTYLTYGMGMLIAFVLLIYIEIRDEELTLGDLIFAVMLSSLSWIAVVVSIIFLVGELDQVVIWRKK